MYFITDKGKLWYTDTMKGSTALVLLHGYLESAEIWNGFADKLKESFRIIAVDLPGHGRSEFTGDVYTMEMIAEVLCSLIDSLELRKVFMTGHSLGGYVTLSFLEKYPEYLTGYCLFHSHPFPDTPETAEKRRKDIALVNEGKKDSIVPDAVRKMYATGNLSKFAEAVERSIEIGLNTTGRGLISILKGMIVRSSKVSLMEEGRVPCLWILGAFDNFIVHDSILARIKLPSNATVITLENSGHMGFIEEQELSAGIFSEYVAHQE